VPTPPSRTRASVFSRHTTGQVHAVGGPLNSLPLLGLSRLTPLNVHPNHSRGVNLSLLNVQGKGPKLPLVISVCYRRAPFPSRGGCFGKVPPKLKVHDLQESKLFVTIPSYCSLLLLPVTPRLNPTLRTRRQLMTNRLFLLRAENSQTVHTPLLRPFFRFVRTRGG